LTVQPPIPVPAAEITTGSVPQITVTASEPARAAARQLHEPAKKKPTKTVSSPEPRDRYAFDPFSRPVGTIQ
jgi:hypothetical protein